MSFIRDRLKPSSTLSDEEHGRPNEVSTEIKSHHLPMCFTLNTEHIFLLWHTQPRLKTRLKRIEPVAIITTRSACVVQPGRSKWELLRFFWVWPMASPNIGKRFRGLQAPPGIDALGVVDPCAIDFLLRLDLHLSSH